MSKHPAVYILTNKRNGTLYTGVTGNLRQRMEQHYNGTAGSFSRRYGCRHLVYVEFCLSIEAAYMREKQIKGGSRKKKLALIESVNPDWNDLSQDI